MGARVFTCHGVELVVRDSERHCGLRRVSISLIGACGIDSECMGGEVKPFDGHRSVGSLTGDDVCLGCSLVKHRVGIDIRCGVGNLLPSHSHHACGHSGFGAGSREGLGGRGGAGKGGYFRC